MLATLCLALTGCIGEGDGASTVATEGTVVPTASDNPVRTELGAIVWTSGIDPETAEPIDRREAFARDVQTIYAAVETGPLAAGTTLTATWAFNGQPIQGADVTVTAEESISRGWVEFHLDWSGATLWPVGTLSVEISASTGESTTSSVEIQGT